MGREQFEENGASLLVNPELICRVGQRLLPYQLAAPAVLGMAAFGGQWDILLPEHAGVRMAVPSVESLDRKQVASSRGFMACTNS